MFHSDRVTWGRGGGPAAFFARLYRKNVGPLYRCPGAELLRRINTEGNGYAGLSFSFSCTNDVVADHSCFFIAGVQREPRRTDRAGLGLEECQEQDGRRGDVAHDEAGKGISTSRAAGCTIGLGMLP